MGGPTSNLEQHITPVAWSATGVGTLNQMRDNVDQSISTLANTCQASSDFATRLSTMYAFSP